MMKTFCISSILVLVVMVSCNNQRQKQQGNTGNTEKAVDSLAVFNDPKNKLNIEASDFFEIDSSGIFMFPLGLNENKRTGSGQFYSSTPGNTYWNIIFLNTHTGEQHLLSNKKMWIKNYSFNYAERPAQMMHQEDSLIFYAITTDDYNKDDQWNEADPVYLFVTDARGKNFKQISPAQHHVLNWKYAKGSNKIIMTVKKDSDANGSFDAKDEVLIYVWTPGSDTAAIEMLKPGFKKDIKQLYHQQWKVQD